MVKWRDRVVAVAIIVILCFSLVACSSEQTNNGTKEEPNSTAPKAAESITTEAIVPTQGTTIPATTEPQTEPPETETEPDISDVVFKEETYNGATYLVPQGWRHEENESGTRFYNADMPGGAYIYVISSYSLAEFDSFYDEYVSGITDGLRSGWPNLTAISTETFTVNKTKWVEDKVNCEKNKIGIFRFTIQNNGVFHMGAVYPTGGVKISRFLAIYEKMFESIDLRNHYVKRPLSSLMDLESGIVLVDDDYVKITFEGISQDTGYIAIYPIKVNLLIENKTDSAMLVTVGYKDLSVNGFMCDAMMYAEMGAKKKAHEGIAFTDANLQQAEISSPYDLEEMEWTFHVMEDGKYQTLEDIPAKLSIYD